MTTLSMNGVTSTLKFQDLNRWELVLESDNNCACIEGTIEDSKHSITFKGEEAKLEFHEVHWKLAFGSLEEGIVPSEFEQFVTIAKEMGVKMAILCPKQCFKDYLAFKPDIAKRTERISTYLAADWHEDSVLGQQISQIKSVCKKHGIEFQLELVRDFFECTDSIDGFNKSLTKSDNNHIEFIIKLIADCQTTTDKKEKEEIYKRVYDFIKSLTKSDHDHREFLIKLIADCQTTTNKKEKAEICIRIYEYLLHNALHYVNKTPKFKDTVIRKAYELKLEGIPELTQIIDEFLTAIGEPLVEPSVIPSVPSVVPIVEYCPCCDNDSDDGYFDTWSQYLGDNTKGGPCDQEKARSKLMQDLFKKENLKFTIKVMPLYYEWAKTNETTTNVNRYKKMCSFIDANRHALMEHDVREALMTSLFKEKNLKYYDRYMNEYYEWEAGAPKVNRYKKMCLFIDAYWYLLV